MNNTVNKTSRYAAAVFHLCKDECLFKIGSKNSFFICSTFHFMPKWYSGENKIQY